VSGVFTEYQTIYRQSLKDSDRDHCVRAITVEVGETGFKPGVGVCGIGRIYRNWRTAGARLFLADRTNSRAYAIVLRLSVAAVVCRLSVTLCIVAKRCVLEQKLLLRAYRKSYMRSK